ncbi:M55 family metallopeptidase [Athalassotoga saccharophila]|uniref:M55 family metallopeptidase n=1 Tax=Athalassotoga saccharophila TaxID=1441386 RepID=UPI001379816B|nr:M55 family metallopeptidase [Athalassotoga saccharophila]BBJ28284.1 D-aminopeptidase [Athalassotoga saccharophila]
MKIYISTDMEGLPGINSWHQVSDKDPRFLNRYLEETLQWVVDGVKASNQNSNVDQILICDSHALGENISYDFTEYDDRIYLVRGGLRDYYMMAGLDNTFSTVFFVGYHAGVGAIHGIMDHTYSSASVHTMKINGMRMNETLINAAFAGEMGIPVSLVIGDHALVEELRDVLKDTVLIETKKGLSRFAAIMKPKALLRKEVIEGVKTALDRTHDNSIKIYKFTPPYELDIEFNSTEMADQSMLMPGLKRIDGRHVKYTCESYETLLQTMLAVVYTAKIGTEIGK